MFEACIINCDPYSNGLIVGRVIIAVAGSDPMNRFHVGSCLIFFDTSTDLFVLFLFNWMDCVIRDIIDGVEFSSIA